MNIDPRYEHHECTIVSETPLMTDNNVPCALSALKLAAVNLPGTHFLQTQKSDPDKCPTYSWTRLILFGAPQ